jgi:hypothetical protein
MSFLWDKKPPLNQGVIMIETDKAYLAGIIDGEGCICFHKTHKNDVIRNSSYCPRVRITNTNKPLLDWVMVTVGLGNVRRMKMYPSNNIPGYEWYINGKRCAGLLIELLPYLKVKKLQADVVIRFSETMIPRSEVVRGKKLSEETIQIRDKLWDEIVQLNHPVYS